eukprot:Hpha_TRINITY_DN35775_c0_g1::TRINITY_DN35775_c0_g1_i1::g.139932::m.139932
MQAPFATATPAAPTSPTAAAAGIAAATAAGAKVTVAVPNNAAPAAVAPPIHLTAAFCAWCCSKGENFGGGSWVFSGGSPPGELRGSGAGAGCEEWQHCLSRGGGGGAEERWPPWGVG